MTLYDLETGELLEMPSDFDEFSPLGDRDYSDCSETARNHALLLEQTMEKYGFQPYSGEWWHFADTTEYPIESDFDPADPVVFVANCNEYINLRQNCGWGRLLTTIPKGASFTLLQWQGGYAQVCYQGIAGWVSAAYMMPANNWLENTLDTVAVTDTYTYEAMLTDLQELAANYPQWVTLDSAGTSELGRDIPVLILGDPTAEHQVLMQGAIHGREHMTAWLLMAMAEHWLKTGWPDGICVHILPMANPDGVTISQTGLLEEAQQQIYDSDRYLGYAGSDKAQYAARWKANALGVDINRNFDAGWESLTARREPSSERFRGSEPFSSAEARALRDYTLKYDFDVTVSYHASGSLTYYEYGDNSEANQLGLDLAKAFASVSGYPPTASQGTDAGGYKDWVINALWIPSLTVEIGFGAAPLAHRELYSIFVRNYRILEILAGWL